MRNLFLSLLGLVASGCVTAGDLPNVTFYEIEGAPALVPESAAYTSEITAIRNRALADLNCADITIDQSNVSDGRANGDHGGPNVFRAHGCGSQRLYLREARYSYQAEVGAYRVTIIDLTRTHPAALPKSDELLFVRSAIALNAQAATDLQCPRDQVVPQLRNLGRGAYVPVAVGCGRRATYVPVYGGALMQFDLASRVDAPGAPSFVAWPPSDLR
jgi:hypothetical protein